MDEAPLKVLIADDEPLAAERLQLLLARSDGVDLVGTASDGEAAVRLAEGLQPDVMLLDIAMPGMDGIDVARALANRRCASATPAAGSVHTPASSGPRWRSGSAMASAISARVSASFARRLSTNPAMPHIAVPPPDG